MGEDDIRSAHKRLINGDGTVSVRGQPVPNLAGKVLNTVLLLEGGSASDGAEVGPSTTPGKAPIVKRRKQGVDGENMDMDVPSEAASDMEGRRGQ